MRLLRVDGDSMAPTLSAGDYVLSIKIKPRSIRPGLIYIINHSDLGRIIKRVRSQQDSGTYMLCGDNPNSTPSAVIGPVSPERIIERAILAITKSGLKRL